MNANDIIINIIKRDDLFSANEKDKEILLNEINNIITKLLNEKNSYFKKAHTAKQLIFILISAGVISLGAGIGTYNHYVTELNNVVIPLCFGVTSIGSIAGTIASFGVRKTNLKAISEVQVKIDESIKKKEETQKIKKETDVRIEEIKRYISNANNPTICTTLARPLPIPITKKVHSLLLSDLLPIDTIVYAISNNEVDLLKDLLDNYVEIKDTDSLEIVAKRNELLAYKNKAQIAIDEIINPKPTKPTNDVTEQILQRLGN